MFKQLKLAWNTNWLRMIGDADRFSLESRIFHSLSITAILSISAITVYNFLTSLRYAAIISVIILVIQICLFRISRYKGKSRLAINLSVVQINIAAALAYFYNAGVSGSLLLLFIVSLYFIFLIIPHKSLPVWYIFNLLLVLGVLCIEYFYPASIQQYYLSRFEWFADIGFTYLIVSIMIAMGTIQLRNGYGAQKERAEGKAMKLELMNKEKDKLFSIIGHDLNTPLNSLQQYLHLLNDMDLNAEERRILEQDLSKSLSDAQYLLGNLLEWAKSQLQNIPVQLFPVPVETQLLPTIRMFEQIASRKEITLILNFDKDLNIIADKNMFDLVIRNLLNNAIKFTDVGGKIWLGAVAKDDRCVLSIKDNGIGISVERQLEIFSLNIASSYGTNNEKGTGLGLVLCKDFIEQQNGKIWFTSNAEGTTFYIEMALS